jgi:hypothetical protein
LVKISVKNKRKVKGFDPDMGIVVVYDVSGSLYPRSVMNFNSGFIPSSNSGREYGR